MAAEGRKSHRYLGGALIDPPTPIGANDQFELDEADVLWSSISTKNAIAPSEVKISISIPRRGRKPVVKSNCNDESPKTAAGKSLPVNMPDWSKILGDEHKIGGGDTAGEDEFDGSVPIHEYLARKRGASFSVTEGIGRTLKGRDLRRVRDAVLKKTGFLD